MTAQYDATAAMQIVNAAAPGAACVEDGVLFLEPSELAGAVRTLRDSEESDLVFLSNLTAVDRERHFEVVYHLQSLERNQMACAKVEAHDRENASVASVVDIWQGAWIQESETYDLFGIEFEGHPNLQRILLWDGYPGHPLRKDFLSMPGGLQPGLNEFAGTSAKPEPPVRPVT